MFFLIVMCFIKSFLVTSVFFQNDVIFLIYTYNTGWADPFFELYIYICTTLVMLLAEVWLCDLWWNASPNFFFMNYLSFIATWFHCSKKDNMRLIWCSTVCSVVLATRKKFVDESYYRKHVMSFLVVKCGIKFIHICICI